MHAEFHMGPTTVWSQGEEGVAVRFCDNTVGFLFIANFSSPTGTIEISSNKIDSLLNHGGTDR